MNCNPGKTNRPTARAAQVGRSRGAPQSRGAPGGARPVLRSWPPVRRDTRTSCAETPCGPQQRSLPDERAGRCGRPPVASRTDACDVFQPSRSGSGRSPSRTTAWSVRSTTGRSAAMRGDAQATGSRSRSDNANHSAKARNRTPMLRRNIHSPRCHRTRRARGGPNTSGRDLAGKVARASKRSTAQRGPDCVNPAIAFEEPVHRDAAAA